MYKTIRDFNINNKTIIIRCDFNVPTKENKIIDDTRIQEAIPTIKYAIDNNAKVILLSHFGKVKTKDDLKSNSLIIVYNKLYEHFGNRISFVPYTRGKEVDEAVARLVKGDIILLENTRFEDIENEKESTCNLELAKYWASLGDIFINDAFGTIHRKHASNFGISKYLDSAIGFLIEKEMKGLDKLLKPVRPFTIILGGSKLKDKLKLLEELINIADNVLIGGGMANTFLKAKGVEIGKSIYEEDYMGYCHDLLSVSKKIVLPIDYKVADEYVDKKGRDTDCVKTNEIIMDIGKETINLFDTYISNSKTIFWNGPLGVYEFKNYKNGSTKLIKSLMEKEAYSFLGGGDIVACAKSVGINDNVVLSTGGGATLEYLEGKTLPGLVNIGRK